MSSLKIAEPECEGCGGICCKYHLITFHKDNFVAIEYHKQRAEKIIKFNDKFDIAVMYQPCPLFDEKAGLCTDYKNRNSTCKDWPVAYKPEWAKLCALMRRKLGKKRIGKYQVLKI